METLLACITAKAIAGLGFWHSILRADADAGAESALVVTLIGLSRIFLDFNNFLQRGQK